MVLEVSLSQLMGGNLLGLINVKICLSKDPERSLDATKASYPRLCPIFKRWNYISESWLSSRFFYWIFLWHFSILFSNLFLSSSFKNSSLPMSIFAFQSQNKAPQSPLNHWKDRLCLILISSNTPLILGIKSMNPISFYRWIKH